MSSTILPATFKRAVFKEHGGPLEIEETRMVPPGKGEVLVKVEACGVCFSDMYVSVNGMGGGFPLAPGHEIIGRVAALGEGVSSWKVGDRVGAGWHGGHDGTCKACKKGFFQMCDTRAINGETRNGGYAEFCNVRHESLAKVPENLDAAKYAPIACAGVTVYNAIRRQNIPIGATVAVQGMGGLGHLAIQYANRMGYRVVAISRSASKEKFAKELGAHDYVDTSKGDVGESLQALGGASLVVSTVPNANAMKPLLKGLGMLGRLLILSIPGEVPIDTLTLLTYGLSVTSWPSGHAIDLEETIEFTERSKINCMIEKFPLARAQEAYQKMLDGSVKFRSVIVMD